MLKKGHFLIGVAVCAIVASGSAATAQELLRLGLIESMTGPFNAGGKAVVNGALLYLKQHGDVVVKDDAGAPDTAKRLAQELIVNDKVAIIGAGITPAALSIAPLLTEAKIPTVVMVAGASVIVERSPYMVRTSFTLGQQSATIADWAVKNGAKKVVTLVSDWAPGLEAEATFKERAVAGDASIIKSMRVPLASPDFAPFLQRARDDKPDTLEDKIFRVHSRLLRSGRRAPDPLYPRHQAAAPA